MTQAHLDVTLHSGTTAVTMMLTSLSTRERLELAAACLRGLLAGRFTLRAPQASLRYLSHGRPARLVAQS